MILNERIEAIIRSSESKALASYSDKHGLNVVAVSTLTIRNGKIILMNYFMGKTYRNFSINENVALACWKGLEGIQIKATVEYNDEGSLFEEMKQWISEILPSRVLHGILILTPQEIFDISANAEHAGKKLY